MAKTSLEQGGDKMRQKAGIRCGLVIMLAIAMLASVGAGFSGKARAEVFSLEEISNPPIPLYTIYWII
ncbi:MAG: hypothetical protein AB1665_05825 [Candidatus Thermoplasmatota archaeon]